MPQSVFILGAYGGAGRTIARALLQFTDFAVVLGGRDLQKLERLESELQQDFPGKTIHVKGADATRPDTLRAAFSGCNWVVYSVPLPEYAYAVAEAALDAGADYYDILVSNEVPQALSELRKKAEQEARLLITQGGFHPGIPAALIRYGARFFDEFRSAEVAIAMNAHFETAESSRELILEMANYQAQVVENGRWRKARYKDMRTVVFGPPFGAKYCVPLYLQELDQVQEKYRFSELGLYIAGFNWVVDNFIFPIIMVVQWLKKGVLMGPLERLLKWGVNTFSKPADAVEMRFHGSGLQEARPVDIDIVLRHADPYWFTAAPVAACFRQLESGLGKTTGLKFQAGLVDPDQFMKDLREMGVSVELKRS